MKRLEKGLAYLEGVYGGEEAGECDEGEEVPCVSCHHYDNEEQPAAHHHLHTAKANNLNLRVVSLI